VQGPRVVGVLLQIMSYFTFSPFPPQMLGQKARVLEVYLNQANGHFEIAIYARVLAPLFVLV